MDADQVIEQIRGLSKPDDLDKVGKALEEHRLELLGDFDASSRIRELREGKTKALTHEEVFTSVRSLVREA
jgi:hypothetical protein